KSLSVFARLMGFKSEKEADHERGAIRRREREQELYYRAEASRSERQPDEINGLTLQAQVRRLREENTELRRELQLLRSQLPATIAEHVRVILADELPEALSYATAQRGCFNGQA